MLIILQLLPILIFGGFPFIYASLDANIKIGNNCKIINNTKYNRIGVGKKTSICAEKEGRISIGNNVGLSGVSICSHSQITIGNNVLIGANAFIFDTDFHSLSYKDRINEYLYGLPSNALNKPIKICDNVFIGANCIITKGVTIGYNSIIAAGSVIVKDVPPNQIWGGNPAVFIREINL